MDIIKKILCRIFGHPDTKHLHREDDVVACNGGCENNQDVAYLFPCPRCGYGISEL